MYAHIFQKFCNQNIILFFAHFASQASLFFFSCFLSNPPSADHRQANILKMYLHKIVSALCKAQSVTMYMILNQRMHAKRNQIYSQKFGRLFKLCHEKKTNTQQINDTRVSFCVILKIAMNTYHGQN